MNEDHILLASWVGTGLFALSAISAVAAEGLRGPAVVVAITMFGLGVVFFLYAYALAVRRSRTANIGIGGLFFLAGDTAPKRIKLVLLGSLTAQVVLAFATAAARPFTSLAFGILVPVYGLALCGLWASRHGRFGPRTPTQ